MRKDILLLLSFLNFSAREISKLEAEEPGLDQKRDDEIIEILRARNGKKKYIQKVKADWIARYKEKLYNLDIETIAFEEAAYPESLRYIEDAPRILYRKGTQTKEDELAIAIVGSRKCSSYGRSVCGYFASELAKLGITIISGLAYGIDSVAHQSSLDAGGRTIAVLGNGIDVIYPSKNRELYERIAEHGAILTEYPLQSKPEFYHFPHRNRIISGLSLGVLVVEAHEKSGSLITAGFAAEQGKELFAVPGNISQLGSRGTNRLIADGAYLAQDVDDILLRIQTIKEHITKHAETQIRHDVSDEEQAILDLLAIESRDAEDIAMILHADIHEINATLTLLEMQGLITSGVGGIFERTT